MTFLYLFAFLAGIATVFSPCVLPVLPAILSAGAGQGRYRPLGVIIGLTLSFIFFTLSLTFLVHAFGISADLLRNIAIIIIALFGVYLLFPSLGDSFAKATASISNLGSKIQARSAETGSGFISGLLLGCALGLIWTPCAGPILAAITTLIATQKITFQVIMLLSMYSLGTAIPLLVIAYGGNIALTKIPSLSRHTETIRKGFGVLMILTAIALSFNLESALQQMTLKYFPSLQIDNNATVQEQLNQLRPSSSLFDQSNTNLKIQGKELPKIVKAPQIAGIDAWLNSPPLTIDQLKGKVVLIDFWTYSCINCIRTLPYLTSWYDKYKDHGLVIIGIHTPEFEFEKNRNNVKSATERFHILYPVALDNEYKTWLAFDNNYWPAHYLIDQEGIIREVHFGEGNYMETENAIRNLLRLPPSAGQEKPTQMRKITPETYLGTFRADRYQPEMVISPGKTALYHYQPPLQEDRVGLRGNWLVGKEKITSKDPASSLDLNFIATRVYLVMDSTTPQAVTVLLNDAPLPSKYYTADMDDQGRILVNEPRKYDVIDLQKDYGRYKISLVTPEGVSMYAFTFGDEP